MVRMAAVDNDHHHHRGAKFASPPSNSMSPAPPPPPSSSRTRLHDFSFPTLSWGTHRLLRCSKGGGNGPASSPPPSGPDTPSPDKEKPHRPEGAGGSLQRRRAAQRPWNLRTRRSATAAPARPSRPEGADEEEAAPSERAPAPAAEAKKRGFSIALSKDEIAEDFVAIRGSRPPRRPKKRPRTVQRQLDVRIPMPVELRYFGFPHLNSVFHANSLVFELQLLYPGLCLADMTPGSYKIEER
ncbi:unnamed protein product [Urochloa decumbens]|uniref:Uncharacterized protein n=1 Tax=Urochloa decumbens TaxID=240449 RepID=A0ABC9H4X5_9POAL